MRISDWSSDVCSSDLDRRKDAGHRAGGEHRLADQHIGRGDRVQEATVLVLFGRGDRDVEVPPADLERLLEGQVGDEVSEPPGDLARIETAQFGVAVGVGEAVAGEEGADVAVAPGADERSEEHPYE